jgi:hypothetical protein
MGGTAQPTFRGERMRKAAFYRVLVLPQIGPDEILGQDRPCATPGSDVSISKEKLQHLWE